MTSISTALTLERFFTDLDRLGFAIYPDALVSAEVQRLKTLLDSMAHSERKNDRAWFSHKNQRVFNLPQKGVDFLRLIAHPIALEIVDRSLGNQALLSSLTANIALPGNSPQHLHADQEYLPAPWIRAEVINLIWALDEFTNENGATRVVEGSHLIGSLSPKEDFAFPIKASAGSLICLDGRVWHGTGRNTTSDKPRRALFAYYCRPYIRQQENFSRSLSAKTRSLLSMTERRLLGFDIWMGLGSVNGLPIEWMNGRIRVGPTNSDGAFMNE